MKYVLGFTLNNQLFMGVNIHCNFTAIFHRNPEYALKHNEGLTEGLKEGVTSLIEYIIRIRGIAKVLAYFKNIIFILAIPLQHIYNNIAMTLQSI